MNPDWNLIKLEHDYRVEQQRRYQQALRDSRRRPQRPVRWTHVIAYILQGFSS